MIGKVKTLWAYLDYKRKNKVLLSDVVSNMRFAALLTNCHTTLYGSETGIYFSCDPPDLEVYLA